MVCGWFFYMPYTNKINYNGNQIYYSHIPLKITSHNKNVPWKLMLMVSPCFYETWNFIAGFTKALHRVLKLRLLNLIHIFTFCFSSICCNTILSLKILSPKISFKFSRQDFVRFSHVWCLPNQFNISALNLCLVKEKKKLRQLWTFGYHP